MISKELLSEVMRMYPQYTKDDYCSGNIQYRIGSNVVHFAINDTGMQQKNVHELAHKCKEWARKRKLYILSFPDDVSNKYLVEIDSGITGRYIRDTARFKADTEPEAIFMACERILEQKV